MDIVSITAVTQNLSNIAIAIGAPISVVQLIRLLWQRNRELKRTKCEETMDDWAKIKGEVTGLITDILEGLGFNSEAVLAEANLPEGATTWSYTAMLDREELHKKTKQYLSTMEHFSVGINFRRYDIKVFDRLYGQTTIKVHKVLTPYLKYASSQKGELFYQDFEVVIGKLERIRKKREKKAKCKRNKRGKNEQKECVC